MCWFAKTTVWQVSTGDAEAGHLWCTYSHRYVCYALCEANKRSFSQLCLYASGDSKSSEVKKGKKGSTVCFNILFYTCCLLSPAVCVCVCGHTLRLNMHTNTHTHRVVSSSELHQRQAKKITSHTHTLSISTCYIRAPLPQHSLTESMSNSAWERKWV